LVKSKVGSSCGTSELEARWVWPLDSKKVTKAWRISDTDGTVVVDFSEAADMGSERRGENRYFN
jgi:hypothetical protein